MAASESPDNLSLEAIENDRWGDAPEDATTLVKTVHELRRKPIGDLTPGDLRVLIGQGVGLKVLVPRAIELLADNPLLEADFHPGDLLAAVLRVPAQYWSKHPDQLARLDHIITAANEPKPDTWVPSDLSDDIKSFQARMQL
jgi:CDI immunity proteins